MIGFGGGTRVFGVRKLAFAFCDVESGGKPPHSKVPRGLRMPVLRHSVVWSAEACIRFLRRRRRWQATALQSSARRPQNGVVVRNPHRDLRAERPDAMPEFVRGNALPHRFRRRGLDMIDFAIELDGDGLGLAEILVIFRFLRA